MKARKKSRARPAMAFGQHGSLFTAFKCSNCKFEWRVGKLNVRARVEKRRCLRCGSKKVSEA
jgi:hypothetical protein